MMDWNMKLSAGKILKGKSTREMQEEEKQKEGSVKSPKRCEIKALHRKKLNWCEDAYQCKDCWYLQKYAPPHKWMCCRCLKQLEEMVQFKAPVLEIYHSGICDLCKEETLLLTPVLVGEGDD